MGRYLLRSSGLGLATRKCLERREPAKDNRTLAVAQGME